MRDGGGGGGGVPGVNGGFWSEYWSFCLYSKVVVISKVDQNLSRFAVVMGFAFVSIIASIGEHFPRLVLPGLFVRYSVVPSLLLLSPLFRFTSLLRSVHPHQEGAAHESTPG